jgi:hypothetical protein
MTKWHYTILLWLDEIRKDGLIKPASDYITLGERPIVWFSTNPDWELTANKNLVESDKVIFLDRAGTEKHYGLARIGVAPETAPYDWRSLKELSGMPGKHAEGLYREAIKRGSRPGQWWGTFDPVPREKWIAVQVYRDGQWVDG